MYRILAPVIKLSTVTHIAIWPRPDGQIGIALASNGFLAVTVEREQAPPADAPCVLLGQVSSTALTEWGGDPMTITVEALTDGRVRLCLGRDTEIIEPQATRLRDGMRTIRQWCEQRFPIRLYDYPYPVTKIPDQLHQRRAR